MAALGAGIRRCAKIVTAARALAIFQTTENLSFLSSVRKLKRREYYSKHCDTQKEHYHHKTGREKEEDDDDDASAHFKVYGRQRG